MEVAAISGMVGFCLGYLVCVFLITGRDDDGEWNLYLSAISRVGSNSSVTNLQPQIVGWTGL